MKKIKFGLAHIVLLVLLITCVIFIGSLYKYLPMKYLILSIVAFTVLMLLMAFIQFSKKTSEVVKLGGKIVSICLCLVLIISNFLVVNKVNDALAKISNGNVKTTKISVIVKSDSAYKKLDNLDGKHFGIMLKADRDNTNYMLDYITGKFDNALTKNEYADTKEMIDALMDGEIDAIIMNEGFRESFNLIDTTFESNSKVVYQIDRKEELKNTKGAKVTKEPFVIYISGIDTNGSISTTSRSDVNMVVAVNPIRKEVTLVFIPRDYYVALQCTNGSCETGGMDKLTHAGLYGIETSEATISNLLGVEINYNVRINFDTVTTMVDELGGIDIYSDRALELLHGKGCNIVEGTQHVNGQCALGFARERYAYESGDRHRGLNQQEVIRAMIAKLSTKTVLSNFQGILSAVEDLVQTNMGDNDIKALVAMQLNDLAKWKINSVSLDGVGLMTSTYSFGAQQLYVMVPNERSIDLAKQAIEKTIH